MTKRRRRLAAEPTTLTEWTDETGSTRGICVSCGDECSTHEDAHASLGYCGDCGRVVCNMCATCDRANLCKACVAERNPVNVIPADTRPHHWRAPGGRRCSFRPNAKLLFVGNKQVFQKNPSLWDSDEPMLASRLFVGFNVGGAPAWTVDDLIEVVSTIRKKQGHYPDASFLVQKGVYTSKQSGETVTEDSAQVIILNTAGEPRANFEKEMVELAEDVASRMKQEEVIVEIQKGGVTQKTFGVAA